MTPNQGGSEPEVVVLPDPAAASVEAARRIAAALAEAVETRGIAHWSTTGGSTPAQIYLALAEPPHRDAVPWDRVHVWWGDDRWVPPGDERSNARPFWELLARRVPIAGGHVHPMPIGAAMDGGHPAAWAAARYAEELWASGVPVAPSGFPILDVVLLGIGPDGHLFSVFPGSSTWDDPAWAQAVPAPSHVEPHLERLTLHPRVVDAARLVLVAAHGAAKAAIAGRLLGPRADERALPALLARRAGAVWILDEAAAANVPAQLRGPTAS